MAIVASEVTEVLLLLLWLLLLLLQPLLLLHAVPHWSLQIPCWSPVVCQGLPSMCL